MGVSASGAEYRRQSGRLNEELVLIIGEGT